MKPIISIKNILFGYEEIKDIFKDFSLDLYPGVTTFVGQNGTGKSTLMLLAAGRLLPENGIVELLNKKTNNITDEEELNSLASIIYQNMEFDTDDKIKDLLDFVYNNGKLLKEENNLLVDEIINVLELKDCLNKKTNTASKGEMQRVIIAFALLYGSPIIFMDEPVFALENNQKDKIFKYILEYSKKFNCSIIYSIHDLDISKKYSDNVVLFFKNHTVQHGKKEDILKKELIEEAYQVPMHLLHEREKLNRETLLSKENKSSGLTGKVID